ncbi:hypothetical protein BY996DRAFT_4020488 [Phakopsora pachyrhizi]|nr:hypothetical protein BY996DRAFT_4020488 [Phakopsora pachyrhizi]
MASIRTEHSNLKLPKQHRLVYCDGACSGNGRKGVQTPAGSGVWWQDTGLMNPSNIAKRLPGPAQSNIEQNSMRFGLHFRVTLIKFKDGDLNRLSILNNCKNFFFSLFLYKKKIE